MDRVAAALLVLAACGDARVPRVVASKAALAAPEPFIAMAPDVADFRSWPRWSIPDIGVRSGHDEGEPRFVYARGPLPKRGAPFPAGTILVKTLERGAPPAWEVHAMVKRGGGYNADGADGWEWLDLRLDADGRASITWRGLGTEDDHGAYGPDVDDGTPLGCNGCHGLMRHTDHVFTRGLLAHEPADVTPR